MNKLLSAAALALILAAGAVSAQESDYRVPQSAPFAGHGVKADLALLHRANAFGIGTTSAFSRNVGPGSTVTGQSESPIVNANAGMAANPLAPSAGPVSGGN